MDPGTGRGKEEQVQELIFQELPSARDFTLGNLRIDRSPA